MNSILGIIPARGGSKGLPRKNILPLNGKPLIVYSIEAALESKLDRIIVTTDDEETARIARNVGAEVLMRPAALATDSASSESVVLHVVESLGVSQSFEHLCLLQPTSPLRNAEVLSAAIESYRTADADCMVSVCRVEHHPYKDFKIEGGVLLPAVDAKYLSQPRQRLPHFYRQNGAIYLVRMSLFVRHQTFYLPGALPWVMKAEQSIDVDCRLDLLLCEQILQGVES
jgi:CMP-N-acetylneuraminic acid synthetase